MQENKKLETEDVVELEEIEIEEPQIEESEQEPVEELEQELIDEEPIVDPDFVYTLKRQTYDTQEALAEAGGCPPGEHIWRSSFAFGVKRCMECKTLRRKRK